MAPDHVAAEGSAGRLQHFPTAYLLVALRRQLGDDQLALLVEQEEAVAVLDDEVGAGVDGARLGFTGDGQPRLPKPLTGGDLDRAELARLIGAVQNAALGKR